MNNLELRTKKLVKGKRLLVTNFPDFFSLKYLFFIECKEVLRFFPHKKYRQSEQFAVLKKVKGILLIYFSEKKYYELYDFLANKQIKKIKFKQVENYFEEYKRVTILHRKRI